MKTARKLVGSLVCLAALGGASAPAAACPVVSLWHIVGRAETIALARVDRFEKDFAASPAGSPTNSQDEDLESSVAVLDTLETWKGSPQSLMRVHFAGPLSSGGREVREGDRIVVFFESGESQIRQSREEDEERDSAVYPEALTEEDLRASREFERRWEEYRVGRWFLAGPVLFVAESSDLGSLRDLLVESVRLQSSGAGSEEVPREWLLRAAAIPETREEAIQDIQGGFLQPEREAEQEPGDSSPALSESERRAIADAFLRDPRPDSSIPGLMIVLAGLEDESLDAAFSSMIEAGVSARETPLWVPEAIRQLIIRRGRRDWGAEIWERDLEAGALKQIWPAVVRDLDLPAIRPRD